MTRRRLVHPQAASGARLELESDDLHHLERVLRLRPGAELEVVDGRGGSFRAIYRGSGSPQVEVLDRVVAAHAIAPVWMGLAVIRGARMDWAVEKLSELGIERLAPLSATRSVTFPRVERWRRIARESARQCGRAALLEVAEPTPLEDWSGGLPAAGSRLLLDPAGEPLGAGSGLRAPIAVAVGPEGGFTPGEQESLTRAGFRRVRLAGPVLRAETAAIAAAAVLVAALAPGFE